MVKTTIKRRPYLEYVNHMLRFFFTTPTSLQCEGHTKADIDNWLAVQKTLAFSTEITRELIQSLYTSGKTFEETVEEFSVKHNIPKDHVWGIYTAFSFAVARERGLV